MILRKEMNRTNSLIILAAIILGTFLVFNTTTTTTPMIINVFAEREEGYEKEERLYDYPPERGDGYSPTMNDYYSSEPPMAQEYNPDRYGGYYGHYEGDFYLDQYVDGNPYGNANPYENGSPYEMR